MAANKFIGIILLITGLFLIGWAIFSSYTMIQGKRDLPAIFKANETEVTAEQSATKNANLSPEQLEEQIQEDIQNQIEKVLPQENIFKLFNLITWCVFAWILILGGGKIAGLGIKLMR